MGCWVVHVAKRRRARSPHHPLFNPYAKSLLSLHNATFNCCPIRLASIHLVNHVSLILYKCHMEECRGKRMQLKVSTCIWFNTWIFCWCGMRPEYHVSCMYCRSVTQIGSVCRLHVMQAGLQVVSSSLGVNMHW